jgi:integrase/recombinase XerD
MTTFQRVSRDVAPGNQRFLQNRRRHDGRPLFARRHAAHIKALRKPVGRRTRSCTVPLPPLRCSREGRPLPRNILSPEEVVDLVRNMDARDPVGIRNRAVVESLYAYGVRTSELCHLRVGDVNFKDQTATVMHGKGDKTRIVPIGQYASHYIGQYLAEGDVICSRGGHRIRASYFCRSAAVHSIAPR